MNNQQQPPTREQIAEVPVALLRMTIDSLKSSQDAGRARAKQLEALLPQPAPITARTYEPCGIHGTEFDDDCGWCWVETTAEPPSIADMAPGTHAYIEGRFGDDGVCHAHTPGQTNYSAWPGRCYRPRADRVHFDPSTIRDVTAPKGVQ